MINKLDINCWQMIHMLKTYLILMANLKFCLLQFLSGFHRGSYMSALVVLNLLNKLMKKDKMLVRAAMLTHVNGTVSCFCNKRLQNWPTVYTNFST